MQDREKRRVQTDSRPFHSNVTYILSDSRNSCVFRVISSLLLVIRSISALFNLLFFFRSFFFCFCRKQAVPFDYSCFHGFLFDYRSCLQSSACVSRYPSLRIVRIHFGLLHCQEAVSAAFFLMSCCCSWFFHAVEVSQGISIAEAFSLVLSYSIFIEDGFRFVFGSDHLFSSIFNILC